MIGQTSLPFILSGSSRSLRAYLQRMVSPQSHSASPAPNLPFLPRVRVWPRIFLSAVSPHARRTVCKEMPEWWLQVVLEVFDQLLVEHAKGIVPVCVCCRVRAIGQEIRRTGGLAYLG
ncbi:hypothetical protein HOY80DRAFT_1136206 [Tuber brumale]|nr:hypothetical protein HOY80DRAFT_1136206 [Tuber brumale]